MKSVTLGSTGRSVSSIGLGGEGILRTYGKMHAAQTVIREAIDQGITYFDSARVYSESEVYYGSIWKKEPLLRKSIFQTSKSASRQKDAALNDLKNSLERLETDYLDLWQIHDVRTEQDFNDISAPGGALEAFIEARDKGMVRNIGVTGHHDPAVLTRAIAEWPVDTVLLPVNPAEGVLGGFLTQTLAVAREKGIGVIGMKVLGGGHYILPEMDISAEKLIRYALACNITLPIVGCKSPDEVRILLAACAAGPLEDQERKTLEDTFRPYASRLAYYRGVK